MGGLLPFGSIFIEMYFIFTSFWNYKVRSYATLSRLALHVKESVRDLVSVTKSSSVLRTWSPGPDAQVVAILACRTALAALADMLSASIGFTACRAST